MLGPVPLALQASVPLLVDVCTTVAAETGFGEAVADVFVHSTWVVRVAWALVAAETEAGVRPVVVHVTDAFVVDQAAFRVLAVLWVDEGSLVLVIEAVVEPRHVLAVLEQQSLGPVPLALQASIPLLVDVRATVAAETRFGVQPVVVHVTDAFVVDQAAFRVLAVLWVDVGSLVVVNEAAVIEPQRVALVPAVLQPVVVHVMDAFVVHEVAFRVFAVLE